MTRLAQPIAQPVTQSSASHCDVAIVGGGIVGATLACSLRQSGLTVVVVEAQPQSVMFQRQRAYALSVLSSRVFASLGIWPQLRSQIAAFTKIHLSDADYGKVVRFDLPDLDAENLGYVGEHGVICQHLYAAVQAADNITWCAPATVEAVTYDEAGALLTIHQNGEQQALQARLVVGADGARSPLRQNAQIATQGWKYWQSCVTFTIHHEAPSNETAFERFWYGGPMGVLPLPGNRCQIVWTSPHAEAKELQAMPTAEFLERLNERIGRLLPQVELVSDRLLFPVQLMQSNHYTRDRLVLIGDAAHCCHPVGGQGLNLGIRDAAALAEVLQTAHQRGEDVGSTKVLKRYESWRKPENWLILGFTDVLDRVFSSRWLPVIVARRLGLWGLAHIQPLKQFALRLMTGLLGRQPSITKS